MCYSEEVTPSAERLALGPRWRFWRRRRLCVAALALLGFVNLYTARVNLSVAIVHMTAVTPRRDAHAAGYTERALNMSAAGHAPGAMTALLRARLQPPVRPLHSGRRGRAARPRRRRRAQVELEETEGAAIAVSEPEARAEFAWDSRAQGVLLSAFFYGYAASQVPAGLAVARAGAARLFAVSVGASSLLALLTPPAARLGGFSALLALRVVLGLFGGLSLPAMSALWARWAPPSERARLASLAASGTNVGTVLVFFLSGALAYHFGWPAIFYVFGALGVAWVAAWLLLVFESPEEDPRTPPEELLYLRASLAPPKAPSSPSYTRAAEGEGDGEGTERTPWMDMACSPPLMALTVAHVAHNWGAVTFLMQLPRYLHEVHLLEVGHMGVMAAVPYVLLAASLPGAGNLSDMLVRKEMLSVTQARKLLLGGTLALQSALMVAVAHSTTHGVVLGCVLAVVATSAFPRATLLVNHLDLSPKYAGLLMGVTNSLATLPGIVSPVITGFLVTGEDPQQWRFVFYIMAAFYAVGSAAFVAFGSAELQPWGMDHLR